MISDRKTFALEEFQGGIDLRDGLFSKNQTRFRVRKNVWTDKGKKIRRRVPCLDVDGGFSANCQGLVGIDGVLYTFAKKGDTVTHTGDLATQVTTLYFDSPDLCTDWELLDVEIFEGYAAAWIRHTFPSTAYPSLCFMHVWDGLVFAPTFVQDPYLPGSFSPSIADLVGQAYDADFSPVIGLGVSKIWSSTLRGNAHCCRTADGRIWNQRTRDNMLADGEPWCFVVPEGALSVREFIVPRDASTLGVDGRWAYYVLEYKDGDSWTTMEEVAGAPTVAFTWRPVSVASRFAGGWNEIQVQVCWGQADAGIIRLRLVPGDTSLQLVTTPTVSIATGSGTSWDLSFTAGSYRWRTNDLVERAAFTQNIDPAGAAKTFLLGLAGDGFAEVVDITSSFPNGWELEHRRFFKKLVFGVASTGATAINTPAWDTYPVKTGTVTVTAGSPNVVGVGTLFTTQFANGDTVRINGEDRIILSIADNLHLATTTNFVGNASGATIARRTEHYSTYAGGETQVKTTLTTGAAGDNLRINGVDYLVHSNDGSGIYTIRNSAGVAGDYSAAVDATYTVTMSVVPVLSDYQYAFQINENSDWYTNIIIEFNDLAGAEDAVSISCSSLDNTGGLISAIAAVKNRMAICFPGSLQLWAIDQASNATAFLDSLAFGTGTQDLPSPVPFYGSLIIPTQTGWRSISVVGANTDNLQDLNIGEPIATMEQIDVRGAVFWPWHGQMIAAGLRGSDLVFLVLDYSKESKITAWSEWIVAGITDVDPSTMVVDAGKLYFRSGDKLLYFDAEATLFRDFADVAGAAYESDVLWHFNDFEKPGLGKRIVGMDVIQDGKATFSFQLAPYGSFGFETTGPVQAGPTFEGTSYGRRKLPLVMTSHGIAPRITSRDERGWVLQRLALHFLYLGR